MIEGLTDEVMTIVERSPSGLSLAEIYRQSELAETEQDVAGALHRLTSGAHLVKGTDKTYRTPGQVANGTRAEDATASDKPKSIRDDVLAALLAHGPLTSSEIYRHCELATNLQQVYAACSQLHGEGKISKTGDRRYLLTSGVAVPAKPTEPRPERKASKKKAARKKATAKPVDRQGTGTTRGDSDAKSEALEHAIEVTAGQDASDGNEFCLGIYIEHEYDEVRLLGLLEAMAQLQRDQRIQDEIRDIADKLFDSQNRIDAAEVNERHAELVRSMGIPVAPFRPGAPVLPAAFAELLERASADAQEHLDAYLSELDDPVLDYLIEVASSAKNLAEAARAAAGGAS